MKEEDKDKKVIRRNICFTEKVDKLLSRIVEFYGGSKSAYITRAIKKQALRDMEKEELLK